MNVELGMLNVELVAYGDVELFNYEFKIRQFLIAGVAENNSKFKTQNSKFASLPCASNKAIKKQKEKITIKK